MLRRFEEFEPKITNLEIVRYNAQNYDDIDKHIGIYCNLAGFDLGVERLDKGIYQIGQTKAVFVKNNKGIFMRKGPKYINAYNVLDQHYNKVKNKMQNQKNNEMEKISKEKFSNTIQP